MKNKYQKGIYDKEKAIQSYYKIAEVSAKKYNKDFSNGKDWNIMFNVQTRYTVAVELEEYFKEDIMYNCED